MGKYGNSCAGEYLFGFNGQEKVNEWSGVGNFNEFGARGLDTRIGRWLAVDPQFNRQPGWSPYKALYNNPNVYVDPEGETEYNKIIYTGQNGKTSTYLMVLDKDKLAEMRIDNWVSGSRESKWGYYDIIHTSSVNVGKDGKQTVSSSTSYQLRYTRHPLTTWIPELNFDFEFSGKGGFQEGGVYFTSATNGGQDPTKYKSLSKTDKIEVGTLMDALSVLARAQGVRGELGLRSSFADWASAGTSATDNVLSSSDYFKEESKRLRSRGSGACKDCGGENVFKDGNKITDPNEVQKVLKDHKDSLNGSEHQ